MVTFRVEPRFFLATSTFSSHISRILPLILYFCVFTAVVSLCIANYIDTPLFSHVALHGELARTAYRSSLFPAAGSEANLSAPLLDDEHWKKVTHTHNHKTKT